MPRESFQDYFNDKLTVAHQIKIDDEVLIDSIIEGIPDTQLKTQAAMQKFDESSSKHQVGQYQGF